MTTLEQLIADELRRIDPQESGVESKAERLAEAIERYYEGRLPSPNPLCGDKLIQDGWEMRCIERFRHEGPHVGPAVNAELSILSERYWAYPGEPAYDQRLKELEEAEDN